MMLKQGRMAGRYKICSSEIQKWQADTKTLTALRQPACSVTLQTRTDAQTPHMESCIPPLFFVVFVLIES